MTKKVYFNGRFLGRRMTGVDRFALEALFALDALVEANDPVVQGYDFKILIPPNIQPGYDFKHIPAVVVGCRGGQMWEQWDLRRNIPKDGLLVSLCNTAPAFFMRQVVVIHDATTVRIPQTFSRAFRWWYRILMPLLGRSARKILTVSEFSKREIVNAFGIDERKVRVLVEGGEHILRFTADSGCLERFGLKPRPFILAVSSMAEHKNFKLVLDAIGRIEDPPFDVAIAGGANPKVFGGSGAGDAASVKWLGYVSDEELRALYESALCFVFPSFYEGFGIPPLEAMNCGCPVLVAEAASMPEVCGEAALYFDPRDPDALSRLLLRVFGDPELRQSMVALGEARCGLFSWKKTAYQLLQACNEFQG